jgi:hypothetical protein
VVPARFGRQRSPLRRRLRLPHLEVSFSTETWDRRQDVPKQSQRKQTPSCNLFSWKDTATVAELENPSIEKPWNPGKRQLSHASSWRPHDDSVAKEDTCTDVGALEPSQPLHGPGSARLSDISCTTLAPLCRATQRQNGAASPPCKCSAARQDDRRGHRRRDRGQRACARSARPNMPLQNCGEPLFSQLSFRFRCHRKLANPIWRQIRAEHSCCKPALPMRISDMSFGRHPSSCHP